MSKLPGDWRNCAAGRYGGWIGSYPRDASRSELEEAVIRADGSCLLDVSFCRIDQELTARGNWEWLTGAVGGELLRGFCVGPGGPLVGKDEPGEL